ncbi:helix-turn-helix domain-containing protein [Flavobacterium sp.]|jgi:AraC-like DNA-binding protein|uniref:helix-turn-helix domain-containing protein n=1 Tax=Flavobacterium sp. TaxID=239 RepID=UPI0037C05A7B
MLRISRDVIIKTICLLLFYFNFFRLQAQTTVEDSLNLIYSQFESHYYNTVENKIFAQKYLRVAKRLNDKYHIIVGYDMIVNSSDLITGEKYLDSMMDVAKSYDESLVIYTHLRKGQFYCIQRNLKKALENYLLAYKKSTPKNNMYLNHIKYEIAVVKSIMGKHQEALDVFLQMEKNLKNTDDIQQYVHTVFAISNTYTQLGKLNEAEHFINIGLEKTLTNGNQGFHQFFISNRGKIFYKKGKYNLAIADLTSSLKTIKKSNDYANFTENCYYLGLCFNKIRDEKKALTYFNKVDSVFNAKGYMFPEIINSYNKLIEDSKIRRNVNKTLYYTTQLLKADSVVKKNYDFIIDTTHKEYDVPELIADKERLIAEMKMKSLLINMLFICSTLGLIGFLWWYHNKRKKELEIQKDLFNNYLLGKELKITTTNDEKVLEKTNNLDVNIDIIQALLKKLEVFETEKLFVNDVTLEALAKKFETNTSYLSMVINKYKGCSFPTYINNLRIDLAVQSLTNDKSYLKYSIKGLASEVGFSSVQTFSRAFVNKTGMNASFFINQLKSNS